jgi:DNA-binding FrmR family transcriptional regulator
MTVKKGCLTKERKELILKRLNRISGQVNGLKKMIEDDRYCLDILQQISSVHEALRGSGKVLMRNYLEVCATKAIRSKKGEKQEQIYNELMDVIYKFAK